MRVLTQSFASIVDETDVIVVIDEVGIVEVVVDQVCWVYRYLGVDRDRRDDLNHGRVFGVRLLRLLGLLSALTDGRRVSDVGVVGGC